MAKKRLIPIVLLKNGQVVRSQGFNVHQTIGNPINTIRRFNDWGVDELILLDISEEDYHDMRRDDLFVKYSSTTTLQLIKQISRQSFMPLTIGGRVRDLDTFGDYLSAGADKVSINTQAIETPEFITAAARKFGDQCVVVSVDYKIEEDGRRVVYSKGGAQNTNLPLADWCREAEHLGAGELLVNCIDLDGVGTGYDIAGLAEIAEIVNIPVIGCGGAGSYSDFKNLYQKTEISAAAANIFHYKELSYPFAKKTCLENGIDLREIIIDHPAFQREPSYDLEKRDAEIEARLSAAKNQDFQENSKKQFKKVFWCTSCLYPSVNAAPMSFDEEGVCLGCRMSSHKHEISDSQWLEREQKLIEILEESRCPNGSRPDCIIAVSGGKDSYFQTHYIKNILGFQPLLVTYYGNNYSEVGERNLYKMKETFDVDHLILQPSVGTLKALNLFGFVTMGDMNWHNHIGICSTPMRLAVQLGIPTVIWGEHGYADLSGQFNLNDYIEWTYRNRLEHYCRGFDWNYALNFNGLTSINLNPFRYPTDTEIFELNLRGIHLSNYVKWEANEHTKLVREKYGFEVPNYEFDRTYRNMSNLDDIHENGVHDYMKWIKFGYGRCTDHATKDIRAGKFDRNEGLRLINKYDHVKPSDLGRWLDYVGMSEDDFDNIADTFRDPRVWTLSSNGWTKESPQ